MSLYRNISVVLTANTTGLTGGLRAAGSEVERFGKQTRTAAKNSEAASKGLFTSANALKAVKAGAVVAGVALAYSVGQAIKFDSAMRNVNSLMHVSESQFAAMEKRVVNMSRSLPQSATTLAEGLYDITSSGFSGADAMQVLEASAKGASAGLTTTEVSARAVTATLNAYGLQASDAQDVTDTLFQTVNLGVISFDELASNLGDVVGGAAAAKVSIDQVGSAIATMTLAGIGGAEATTSLNRLIQAVIQPSEALASMYDKLGYESGAAALKTKGLHGVMEDLRKSSGGNIETLLKLFPEIRSARGALALMANEGQNYNRVAADIEDKNKRAGATMRTLAEQMKSAKNQAQILKNGVDAAAISLGTALLPVLVKLMHGVELTGAEIGKLAGEIGRELGPTWHALADIFGDLVDLSKSLGDAVGPLAAVLARLAVGSVVVTLNALAQALAAVTGFAADHADVVLLLATVYGVNLVRSLLLAKGGLSVIAWKAFSSALVGTIGSVEGLSAALKGLATSEAAATLGLSAVVTGGVLAWSDYHDAAKSTEEALSSLSAAQKAWAKGSLPDANKSLGEASKKLAEYDALIARVQTYNFGETLLHWRDGYKLLGSSSDDMEKLRDGIHRVNIEMLAANTTAAAYLYSTGAKFADSKQFDAAIADIVSKAQAAGIDLSKGLGPAKSALDGLGISGRKTKEELEKDLISAMGNVSSTAVDAADAVDQLKSSLDALLGIYLSADAAASKYEQAIADITKTVKDNIKENGKHGASIGLTTEAGRKNRDAIRGAVEALKDKIEADARAGKSGEDLAKTLKDGRQRILDVADAAGVNKKKMEELLRQYNLTPEMIKTIVEAVGADAAKRKIDAARAAAERANGTRSTITVGVAYVVTKKPPVGVGGTKGLTLTSGNSAFGNIYQESYAAGGIRALPKSAMIAKDGANLINWAEPGTGGEAFIPLDPSRRKRSMEILASVAEMFGVQLEKAAYGAFRYPAWRAPHRGRKESWADYKARYNQAKSDYIDARYRAAAQYNENKRLYNTAVGTYDGNYASGLAGSSTEGIGKYASDLESRRQASAQYQANRSANPYDSAADFYKKPILTAAGMTVGLTAQTKQVQTWGAELSKIAATAGADVAASLQRMGEQGKDAVAAMSKASTADMRKMADAMRKLDFANFTATTTSNAKAATQFQADLVTLVKMGRADLASKFAEMGYEQAGSLARQAVLDPAGAATLAAGMNAIGSATSGRMGDALKLAAILQTGGGKIGVVGLANRSGMNIADVLGLLATNSSLFAGLGAAMAQVNADEALIRAGKQPSGLANGGIVSGSGTGRGLYYRWAEPGSGGESLIPHSPAKRRRAIDLWSETGRILGVGGGGGGSVVVVQPGAVQVAIPVTNPGATPEQIERVATKAVDGALRQLNRTIKAGQR